MGQIKSLKDVPKKDLIIGGTATCQGCGATLGIKLVLKALGETLSLSTRQDA